MENSENKKRFNVIDIIVIVLVLALIAGLVWFFVFSKTTNNESTETNDISFTVLVKSVDDQIVKNFKTNDVILNSSTNNQFGIISNVRLEKTEYLSNIVDETKETPTAKLSSYPDLFDIYITITSKCRIESTGIAVVDNNPILIGKQLYIKDGLYATSSYVVDFAVKQ